jgi:ubiquinone/menaquinone biosynthesis C-methylase UbiE
MTTWYEKSFGYEYLELYAHRDAAEAQADIQAIIDLLSPPKDEPLLDLCCGACRHLLILREMGFSQLVGLDLSQELLNVAAQTLDIANKDDDGGQTSNQVQLVQSDMRVIPYENHFATILSLFTSFGYFQEDEENQAVFQAAYRALKPGGRFLIDFVNRDYVIANLVEQDEKVLPNRRIQNVRRLTEGCRRVEKTTTVTTQSGATRAFHESVRLYSQTEMIDMLATAGFADVDCYGSLDKQECGPECKRLIVIAEKRGIDDRDH